MLNADSNTTKKINLTKMSLMKPLKSLSGLIHKMAISRTSMMTI